MVDCIEILVIHCWGSAILYASDGGGELISPNYPEDYPDEEDCSVTIEADPDQFIVIDVHDFSTEATYDSLQVATEYTKNLQCMYIHVYIDFFN